MTPWLAIWIHPRVTIRRIMANYSEHQVWLLAGLKGIVHTFDRLSTKNDGDQWELPLLLTFAGLAGPLFGIIGLYLSGYLLRLTGQWLGGKATAKEVRASVAWSDVPMVVVLALWITGIAILGRELFSSDTPYLDEHPWLSVPLLGQFVLMLVLYVWSFVLLLHCLGEVQGFSAWKALGSVLLAGMVLIGVAIALGVVVLPLFYHRPR
jgi:hypothetical protein